MTTSSAVERINPGTWNSYFRYDQAQLRPAPAQLLTLAGQGSIDVEGQVCHEGNMAAQIGAAMDNVAALLTAGGMDLNDVLSMTVYTTDVDAALSAYSEITARLDTVGATPPATLVGVTRLALASMLVEIAVTATN